MKKVVYPFPRLRISLTFRCNFACPYCSITRSQPELYRADEFEEADPSLWIKGIERLEGTFDIVIGVGEPGLYAGLTDIVNAFPEKLTWIYTNGSLEAVDAYMRFKPRPSIRFYVSYHYGQIAPELFAEGTKRIASKFKVWNYHSPPFPPFVEGIEQDRKMLEKLGVELASHPYVGWYKGRLYGYKELSDERFDKWKLKKVWCKTSFHYKDMYIMGYPVAPDGTVYVCHRRLLEKSENPEHIIGNLFGDLIYQDRHYQCDDYGYCHLCAWHRDIIERETGKVLDTDL